MLKEDLPEPPHKDKIHAHAIAAMHLDFEIREEIDNAVEVFAGDIRLNPQVLARHDVKAHLLQIAWLDSAPVRHIGYYMQPLKIEAADCGAEFTQIQFHTWHVVGPAQQTVPEAKVKDEILLIHFGRRRKALLEMTDIRKEDTEVLRVTSFELEIMPEGLLEVAQEVGFVGCRILRGSRWNFRTKPATRNLSVQHEQRLRRSRKDRW